MSIALRWRYTPFSFKNLLHVQISYKLRHKYRKDFLKPPNCKRKISYRQIAIFCSPALFPYLITTVLAKEVVPETIFTI